ncbi:unnamed protein product [Ectocarpus fasciculatus]
MQQTATRVRQSMAGLGVHLRLDWVKHCLQEGGGAERDASGQRQQSEEQEGVYRTFLACDLREAGEACLPAGVGSMVKERVKGKMVVQVENARDIAKNLEQREKVDGSSAHHTLKLALGDGRQTVAAFEYRRVQGLVADPPLGLKLLLVEPWVRRGILLLSSENTTVLGGEVSSLVEAREAARAGGTQGTTGAATNATNNDDAAEPRTSRNQPGRPTGRTADGAAGNSGPRAPGAPRNATRDQAENGSRPRPPPGGSRRRHDENADPININIVSNSGVVDLSSSSSSSGGNADTTLSRGRRTADAEEQRSRSASGKAGVVGSSRPSGSGSGVFNPYAAATGPGSPPARSAAASTRARVHNPYSASTLSATSSAAAETVGTARSESQQGAVRSISSGSSGGQGRPRGGEASTRVPAFQDLEDDDGPGFEYLEEPDFDDEEDYNEPPEEAIAAAAAAVRHGRNPGMRSDAPRVSTSAESSSPAAAAAAAAAAVTPRPTIVSAKVQKEKLRQAQEEEESRKRRRGRGEGGGIGGGDGGVADIEGEFGGGGRSRNGPEVSSRSKRGRSSSEIGNRAGGDRERSNETRPSPPSGPYTSLEDLDRLAAAGGGMFRVKAVVSDTKNCKIRKKKYLLVVEIEDGTAVVSVRLSEQITRRLFGVEAREFKKIFQADPAKAISIQTRVEKEIREMEGVMEIHTSAGATSSQSPATPGAAMSQNSATGDSEWGLPMVVSVKPPTDGDCHELLSRVTSLL